VFNISKVTIRRLVVVSTITTLVALALMVAGIVFPRPLLLVLAMSLGQLFGTISLVLYLLAIVLDLQGIGEHEELGRAPAGVGPVAQRTRRAGRELRPARRRFIGLRVRYPGVLHVPAQPGVVGSHVTPVAVAQ
jgi:hypothetical protein